MTLANVCHKGLALAGPFYMVGEEGGIFTCRLMLRTLCFYCIMSVACVRLLPGMYPAAEAE